MHLVHLRLELVPSPLHFVRLLLLPAVLLLKHLLQPLRLQAGERSGRGGRGGGEPHCLISLFHLTHQIASFETEGAHLPTLLHPRKERTKAFCSRRTCSTRGRWEDTRILTGALW